MGSKQQARPRLGKVWCCVIAAGSLLPLQCLLVDSASPHLTVCWLMRAGVKAKNPSQDLDTLASRLRNSGPRTVIAVAPAFEQGQGGVDVFSDDKMPSSRGDVASLNSGEGGAGEANRGSADGGGMGAGAEMLAAEEFSSWLIDELGGDEG